MSNINNNGHIKSKTRNKISKKSPVILKMQNENILLLGLDQIP